MVTTLQYFIFETEFIGLCKRLTSYLKDRNYTVGLNIGANNSDHDYLCSIETLFHHRYINDSFIASKSPNDKYDFGEIFDMQEEKDYRSSPILEWEFVDGGSKLHKTKGPSTEIRLTVEQNSNNLDYSMTLTLDSTDENSQVIKFNFMAWRTVLKTIVSHIQKKFE